LQIEPLRIVLDFITGETNDFDTHWVKPLASDSIFLDSYWSEVWQSIALDNKFRVWTKEIQDVRPEFMLASKLGLATLPVTNELPHQVFSGRSRKLLLQVHCKNGLAAVRSFSSKKQYSCPKIMQRELPVTLLSAFLGARPIRLDSDDAWHADESIA